MILFLCYSPPMFLVYPLVPSFPCMFICFLCSLSPPPLSSFVSRLRFLYSVNSRSRLFVYLSAFRSLVPFLVYLFSVFPFVVFSFFLSFAFTLLLFLSFLFLSWSSRSFLSFCSLSRFSLAFFSFISSSFLSFSSDFRSRCVSSSLTGRLAAIVDDQSERFSSAISR